MTGSSPQRRRSEFPWWLLAMALLGVLTLWGILNDTTYNEILVTLARGIWTTVWVTVVAFALAVSLGLLIALARTSRHRILRELATFYIELVRGIPVLVFLFYVAFVGAPWLVGSINWLLDTLHVGWLPRVGVRDFDFTWRAILALTICYSSFIAEIFRAGIEAVSVGQVEAARSLGMRPAHIFRHIVFPQALRTILPPLGNDLVSMIKDSALVSALGVQDITQLGKLSSAASFRFFETYNVVAFLYLTMTIGLSLLVRLLERHLRNRGS